MSKGTVREHHLKCWPSVFSAVEQGLKPWEFRKNDRDYAVGDVLHLHEWDPSGGATRSGDYARGTMDDYMGKPLSFQVTYIIHGGRFGVPEGYCAMTLEPKT